MVIDKEIEKIKDAINNLVYEKTALRKAYQYYHGYRDAEQFKHLEDNYGIGTPTSVSFTPLIKKHIDVLVGEYMGINQDLKITCKDEGTISNIMREKQLQIDKEVYEYLNKYVQSKIIGAIISDKESSIDPFIEDKIKEIKDSVEHGFVSEYEIAAQNILKYFSQSRSLDMKRKVTEFFTDILIGGSGYYRTYPNENKTNVCLEILNPLDTFIERNPNSPYLADSRRAVIRKWMTKEDVLSTYRSEITDEAAKKIEDMITGVENSNSTSYIRYSGGQSGEKRPSTRTGILAGLEAHPGLPQDDSVYHGGNHNLIEVFEVEWIEVDRKDGKQTRHEGVQIGGEVYITRGESDFIVRSADCPNKCRLSVNGIFFLDKNGDPYSLMVNTMDLQD